VFVEQQVILAVVAAPHMPMEIPRLSIKREGVGNDRIDRFANLFGSRKAEIVRRRERAWKAAFLTPARALKCP